MLKGNPEADWCSLLPSFPPSPAESIKVLQAGVALGYTAFACTALSSPYRYHSLCIDLANTISAIHSGWAPLTMLISKRTQCTLHLPSHLSEVHAAQPQKPQKITSLSSFLLLLLLLTTLNPVR